jgi:hypothetical protein
VKTLVDAVNLRSQEQARIQQLAKAVTLAGDGGRRPRNRRRNPVAMRPPPAPTPRAALKNTEEFPLDEDFKEF